MFQIRDEGSNIVKCRVVPVVDNSSGSGSLSLSTFCDLDASGTWFFMPLSKWIINHKWGSPINQLLLPWLFTSGGIWRFPIHRGTPPNHLVQ